jgi:hypothetical protein
MSENFEQKSELDLFREKIAQLKKDEEEARRRGESTTRHLRDLDPMLLTEEDMNIYHQWQEGSLLLDEFNAHRNKIINHDKNANSGEFLAYIGNRMMKETWKTEFNREK